jgi:di/tricarboxylate transporter
VTLMVFVPWTGVSPHEGVSGFANPATITILAMMIVAGELELQQFRSSKLPLAVGIVLAVVGLAALQVLPVMVAALGGVIVMLVTDVVKPAEAYEAVQWDVIFLLAGVIPLGRALSETGGADLLGTLVVSTADFLPPIAVLGLFYGPGGYEFRDFVRVGGPLQVILAVVTTLGIATFWGL